VDAGVVDADDDQGLDLAREDQGLGGFVDVPLLADRRRPVEDVLAVVQVEHGVAVGCLRIVPGGEVDDDGAVVLQVPGVEPLVGPDVAGEGVLGAGLGGVGHIRGGGCKERTSARARWSTNGNRRRSVSLPAPRL
jgi:hypothetical protein